MIENSIGRYSLQCDFCSNYVDDLISFDEAVNYKKANGWKSQNIKGEWFDKCPNCLESGGN